MATIAAEGGHPYASLVTVATDHDGSPLLLLSRLAEHSGNIGADPRLALLFDGTAAFANPQEGPRVTLIGRAVLSHEPRHRVRFLARHPAAAMYAGFADFSFYRIQIERAHYVAGFARALWLTEGLTIGAEPAARMAMAEGQILAHMNEDHRETLDLYAKALLGRRGRGWRMAAVDADGCDLARGETVLRLAFESPVEGPEQARLALIELARRARTSRARTPLKEEKAAPNRS